MPKKSSKTEYRVPVEPPKGRPLLYWVGKQPLDYVKGFPARLTEVFDPSRRVIPAEAGIRYLELKRNWQNLLFHGDNKEVLATLLENGFRGKADLIYIDPPFDSGANYVRKAELRGVKSERMEGADYTPMEQTMYFDIWRNDSYLQWMYERLQLMKELLANDGSIVLHTDWHRGATLRLVMDEIFGEGNFLNEIIWHHDFGGRPDTFLPRKHDNLFWYRKGEKWLFNLDTLPTLPYKGQLHKYKEGAAEEKTITDVWDIAYENKMSLDNTGYPTQKPKELLKRIIEFSTQKDSLVLDCFVGSGTTQAVAQKLGRRWIGCDINKGAIQTTSKRLQKIINEQVKEKEKPKYPSFAVYQVNDYDLQILRTEAVELAVEHIGIERRKTDQFFDGLLGRELTKIIDFNHPLTLLDLQIVEDELKKRPDEERNIVLVCLGKELAADGWLEAWNKKPAHAGNKGVNKIRVIELRTDKKYGKFFTHQPDIATVNIERKGGKAVVDIKNFISPAIIERLNDGGIFKMKIPDFRAMIDTVLIDTNYDGKTFRVALADVPEKKSDYITGHYELDISKAKTTVAVKIIDMLGEEMLVTKQV